MNERLLAPSPLSRLLRFVVMGGLLLVSQPVHAFELKRTELGDVVSWRDGSVVMRVAARNGCGPSRGEVVDAARVAADAWRGIGRAPDVVVEGGDPPHAYGEGGGSEAGRGIYILCDWPFGATLAVTIARFEGSSGRMVDADIVLNGSADLVVLSETNPDDHYDLASVLTHEMGHVLGLEESDARNATMWPTTARSDTRQRTIETDDENGIIAIYGEPNAPEHVQYGCAVSRAGGGASGWAGAVALTLLLARRSRIRR